MNFLIGRTLTLALLLSVAACASRDPHCPSLPGGGRYCLQSTTAVPAFDAEQKVAAAFNGRRETLIVKIEADAESLRFVGLTPFGHKLVHVIYNNREARAVTLADPRLDPALLVALLQLTLWPAEAVRAGLSQPLTLEEKDGQRRILSGSESVATIHYTGVQPHYQRMRIAFATAGLELDVESLESRPEVKHEP